MDDERLIYLLLACGLQWLVIGIVLFRLRRIEDRLGGGDA